MYRVEDERNPGSQKQRFITLGHYPVNTLAEAREKARDAVKLAGKGEDPMEARDNSKRDISTIETVEEAVSAFIVKYAKRHNRFWKEVERVFNSYVLPNMYYVIFYYRLIKIAVLSIVYRLKLIIENLHWLPLGHRHFIVKITIKYIF